MRPTRLITGLIILILGLVLLGINTNVLPENVWHDLIILWPVLLILFGLAFLIRNIYLFSVICLIILFGCGWLIVKNPNDWLKNIERRDVNVSTSELESEGFSENFDENIKNLSLTLDLGAANIEIKEQNDTSLNSLLSGSFGNGLGIDKTKEVDNGVAKIMLKEKPLDQNIFKRPFSQRFLNLYLKKELPTELNVNTGASKLDLDFSKINLTKFSLNSGASNVNIKFGDASNNLSANISSGASKLTFSIPKGFGIKIVSKSALLDKNFQNSGLIKEHNSYFTKDYDSSSKKVEINISSGVSQINVRQY